MADPMYDYYGPEATPDERIRGNRAASEIRRQEQLQWLDQWLKKRGSQLASMEETRPYSEEPPNASTMMREDPTPPAPEYKYVPTGRAIPTAEPGPEAPRRQMERQSSMVPMRDMRGFDIAPIRPGYTSEVGDRGEYEWAGPVSGGPARREMTADEAARELDRSGRAHDQLMRGTRESEADAASRALDKLAVEYAKIMRGE